MKGPLYAIVAEFKDQEDLLRAVEQTRDAGYRKYEAYSPFPVHGLSEAMRFSDGRVPWTIFLAGVTGAVFGYWLQWWINVVDYPINSGGRPFHSWPSFIPVTYECTILFAAFGAVLSMLGLNGLPRPHHPIFNTPRFELASQYRFFLAIETSDPKFDATDTAGFLEGLGAYRVSEVEE